MKKFITILSAAMLLVISSTSCQKWLDVNKNIDAPDYVDEMLYLPGILAENQYFYYDIRAYGSLAKMQSNGSWTAFANHYFSSGSDNGGGLWYVTYFHHGMNLENMINQALEKKEYALAGIGMAIKAYDWDKLTKECGELPCKQAYEPGRTVFEYDYQEDIYPIVRGWANTAIKYLEMEDTETPMNKLKEADYAFGGDVEKWKRLAHSIIVSNLASLTNKKDFVEKYADSLLYHAQFAMQTNADNYITKTLGGGDKAQFSNYNNFWGVYRENLSSSICPHEWATQVMTGTIPYRDEAGDLVNVYKKQDVDPEKAGSLAYQYKLAEKQYCADTTHRDVEKGHFDPRCVCKIGSRTTDYMFYLNIDNPDSISTWQFMGGTNASNKGTSGEYGGSFYGGLRANYTPSTLRYGEGKWLYRNDAPYILMTAAEIAFDVAETYWKMGKKQDAYNAWIKGIELDIEFTRMYINTGAPADAPTGIGTGSAYEYKRWDGKTYYICGSKPGGCPITLAAYDTLAKEYLAGPYVNGLDLKDFTLTHIMLQKFNALYPWGALEAWTDQRKYFYDLKYEGEYPSDGNGWEPTILYHKDENDPNRVFKGYYLNPADVQGCRTKFNQTYNGNGSPCFRIRPRYNSEYMWNRPSLDKLAPISGYSKRYHTSIPWFAYPGDQPKVQTYPSDY